MTAKVFEAALGIAAPWSVESVDFNEAAKLLTVLVDFNRQFGTLATMLGIKPERTLVDLGPFMDDLGTSSAIITMPC